MKKIWSIIALLGYSMSIFAYGSSYDDGFEKFITIVSLIAGILSLILFFKIWGMTNNIKKILKKMEGNSQISPSLRTPKDDNCEDCDLSRKNIYLKLVQGKKTEAIQELNESAWTDTIKLVSSFYVYYIGDEFNINQIGNSTPLTFNNSKEVYQFIQKQIDSQVINRYASLYGLCGEKVPDALTSFDYDKLRKVLDLKTLEKMQEGDS